MTTDPATILSTLSAFDRWLLKWWYRMTYPPIVTGKESEAFRNLIRQGLMELNGHVTEEGYVLAFTALGRQCAEACIQEAS